MMRNARMKKENKKEGSWDLGEKNRMRSRRGGICEMLVLFCDLLL
jgi:hypothetical protein